MPRIARWKGLLEEYPGFNRWYENLARGSRITADENAHILYRFLRQREMTPRIVEEAKKDRRSFEDHLFDFVTKMEKEGKAPTYIKNYLKVVKSWLQFNDLRLVRKIIIGNTSRTPTIEDERTPDKDKLKQIIGYAKPRGKTSICFIAFSGLRPQVLGDYTGIDRLKLQDIPEMDITYKHVEFTRVPAMVIVRPELSKAKHRYFTFLG